MKPFVQSFAGVLLVLLMTLNADAQCKRIEQNVPDFFITYEGAVTGPRAAAGKAYRTEALLRLRNNTDCIIILPSNDQSPSPQLLKLLYRDHTPKRKDAFADGQKATLVYNLNNERGTNGTILVSDGCVIYERSLGAGESVLFSVPLVHVKRGGDVAVQFRYGFEDQRTSLLGGDFGHYIFLRNSFLPKGIAQR
jgi:hypothetical protein